MEPQVELTLEQKQVNAILNLIEVANMSQVKGALSYEHLMIIKESINTCNELAKNLSVPKEV